MNTVKNSQFQVYNTLIEDLEKLLEFAKLKRKKYLNIGNMELLANRTAQIKPLKLEPQNCERTIWSAKNLFAFIYPSYRYLDIKETANNAKQIVEIYEIKHDIRISEIFDGIGGTNSRRYFMQFHVLNFIDKYRNWLRTNGSATFFLVKVGSEFIIAEIYLDKNGSLFIYTRDPYDTAIINAWERNQLIVPLFIDSLV